MRSRALCEEGSGALRFREGAALKNPWAPTIPKPASGSVVVRGGCGGAWRTKAIFALAVAVAVVCRSGWGPKPYLLQDPPLGPKFPPTHCPLRRRRSKTGQLHA